MYGKIIMESEKEIDKRIENFIITWVTDYGPEKLIKHMQVWCKIFGKPDHAGKYEYYFDKYTSHMNFQY